MNNLQYCFVFSIFLLGCTASQEQNILEVPAPEVEETVVIDNEIPVPEEELIKDIVVEEESEKEITEEGPTFEPIWKKRIDDALADSNCPPVQKISYPDSYYQGPLTDTHLHIPSIPDWSAEQEPSSDELEGRFGGPGAFLGWNVRMSEIACSVQHEGTHKNFAFFPSYEDISEQQLYI